MAQSFYIVDIIGSIVAKTSESVLPLLQQLSIQPTITGVHYLYGHHNEIKRRLIEKSNSNATKYTRYPLIALFQDFTEKHDGSGVVTANLQLIIGYHSTATKYMEDRYVHIFKPILYPIYEALLTNIANDVRIGGMSKNNIEHEKIDRPHWGDPATYGNTGYIFSDVLDAIEVRNLKITIDPLYCSKNSNKIHSFINN